MLGTWEGLLLHYDETIDQFVVIKDRNGQLPLSKDYSIFSIFEDNEGFTWIALSGGGVIKMKIVFNTIVSQEIVTETEGLASNFTTTLFQSRNNKVWIGTEAGLSVYDNGECISMYNKDIIFDIQSIAEDPTGFLWIGTQSGIIRINSNNYNEPFKHFSTSDGLLNLSFYLNSIFIDTDFTLYFGGYNGIDHFMPYQIGFNYNKPKPHITNFKLYTDNLYAYSETANDILYKNITETDEIKLKYNQNTFSIEFSNLQFRNQNKCQFAYKLNGVDKDWNYRSANNREAYYTKIKPGDYVFHLKSTNNDGLWSDENVMLKISISPPIWASTLAFIIYFVAAMLTIFSFIYFSIMNVQESHNQKLKEIEHKKQKELNELKLRFFTNISHEFRTPLTLIMGPLARLLANDKNNPYKESHLMIFRNATRLLHLTNRILDFRKNEKDQLKLKVTPINVSDFMYNIFLFFNYEAHNREIDYRFKTYYDGTLLVDKEFLESIAFNLLSNAFKYTPKGRSISVNVNPCKKGGAEITVSDTGYGIKDEDKARVFDRFYSTTNMNSAGLGLSFSKRLIEIHKGELLLESIYGEGASFTIVLPPNYAYTDEEKQTAESQELVADWKKIDQSVQVSLNNKMTDLKTEHDKDDLLALVVDDNFEVRQFIASLLSNQFEILEAQNGKEALELAFENIPDIIISDVMMPLMDGYELCQQLKNDERTNHIPIILTTVLSAQEDRNLGLTKGADSYIPKPIDPEHLIIRVKKLIENQLKLKRKFNLSNYTFKKEEEETLPEIHPLVEKARNIVLNNIGNSDYNIDDFCNDLGLSRMQLYRKFKAITGLSANSFIRKVRIHKAAELLKTGNYSVKEVTYDVGFIDLKYFRKCFFNEFGVNPSDYAQLNTKY
jgi:signal transduction histidine kinase/AraC-like DNA-binding protein